MRSYFASYPPDGQIAAPNYDTPGDAGTGSAGDGTGRAGAGDGSAGPLGAGHQGAPYRLNDDALVDLGDGKPVKWSDARSARFVPKDQHDDYVNRWNKGVEFLTNIAKTYDSRADGADHRGSRDRGRVEAARPPTVDLDELTGMPVVDGATVAKLAREFTGQFQPIGTALQTIAQKLDAQEKRLEALQGATGTLADEHSRKEFDGLFASTVKALPEIKGLKGAIPTDEPIIRDLFEDVFLSHDQQDPTLRREIGSLVAKRIEGLIALVRKMDKTSAEDATKNRRRFPAFQKGAAHGSGEKGYQFQTGSDLANQFFGRADS